MFARNVTYVKCATFFGTYRSNQHAIVFFCVDICRDVFLPAPRGREGMLDRIQQNLWLAAFSWKNSLCWRAASYFTCGRHSFYSSGRLLIALPHSLYILMVPSPSQGPARLQHMARQRWLLPSSSPRGACASK